VNGCCYGRTGVAEKGDYLKLSGQQFWELISGDAELYVKIIEPIGHKAREKDEAFRESRARVVNRFVFEFLQNYSDESGQINWHALVRMNSGR